MLAIRELEQRGNRLDYKNQLKHYKIASGFDAVRSDTFPKLYPFFIGRVGCDRIGMLQPQIKDVSMYNITNLALAFSVFMTKVSTYNTQGVTRQILNHEAPCSRSRVLFSTFAMFGCAISINYILVQNKGVSG